MIISKLRLYVLLLALCGMTFTSACKGRDHYVVASTGTVVGVELSQNAASQTPQGKLGYNRAEVAIVPTNRGTCTSNSSGTQTCTASTGAGATDAADVLMELKYGGIFDFSASSGIYQRLAVGGIAVKQPGASLMFAKGADGELNPAAAIQVNDAIRSANLTEEQVRQGRQAFALQSYKIEIIVSAVQDPNDTQKIQKDKWKAIVKEASTDDSVGRLKPQLEAIVGIGQLRDVLSLAPSVLDPLLAAAL